MVTANLQRSDQVEAASAASPTLYSAVLSCPMCEGDRLSPAVVGVRDRLSHVKGEFDFLRCQLCGSLTLSGVPAEEEIAALYPSSYAVRPPIRGSGLVGLIGRMEWRLLFETVYEQGAKTAVEVGGVRQGTALEVGCSSGFQLRALEEAGSFVVEGIDIDGEAIEYARRVLGLNAGQGDITSANYASESFDLVLLFNVLEHLMSPIDTLREISRVLRPGGVLAVKVPSVDSLQFRVFGRRWQILCEAPRHVLIPSNIGVRILLARAGLLYQTSSPAPTLENAVSIALSLFPSATAQALDPAASRTAKLARRGMGQIAGLISVPIALVESVFGLNGTLIHIAKKPSHQNRGLQPTDLTVRDSES